MELTREGAREQKFACEKVHLDFAALTPIVVDHAFRAGRSGFRRPRWLDFARAGVIAEFGVTELMSD
jgi:hypothetical protein